MKYKVTIWKKWSVLPTVIFCITYHTKEGFLIIAGDETTHLFPISSIRWAKFEFV